MDEKAVVIASGGIDSSTLLFKTVTENYETYALTFIYGQKHKKEIDCAKLICDQLKVSHKIIDVSALKEILSGSALIDSRIAIPNVPADVSHYHTLKATIVPNRNSIFLSIAIGYAVSMGANRVLFGAHHSDRGIYPDCRPEFVEAFQSAERLANDNPDLSVEAPFAHMDKSDIVRLGTKLGVPYQKTWSCYKGDELHCGVCSSCRERKRAFTQSGVSDPTPYEG